MNRTYVWAAVLFCGLAGAAPVRAGLDVDFGARVVVSDRSNLYFEISARYYDEDRATVERAARKLQHSDDLAVALFVARHSRRSVHVVIELRHQGHSWSEIARRLDVPRDVWFVEVERDPGPPYGKAYGHWKKYGRGKDSAFVLSDADARNLVAVRMLHEYFDVSVEVAMDWRASGRQLPVLLAEEYGKRHGQRGGSSQTQSGARHGNSGKDKQQSKSR